jgi:hypothetical protein
VSAPRGRPDSGRLVLQRNSMVRVAGAPWRGLVSACVWRAAEPGAAFTRGTRSWASGRASPRPVRRQRGRTGSGLGREVAVAQAVGGSVGFGAVQEFRVAVEPPDHRRGLAMVRRGPPEGSDEAVEPGLGDLLDTLGPACDREQVPIIADKRAAAQVEGASTYLTRGRAVEPDRLPRQMPLHRRRRRRRGLWCNAHLFRLGGGALVEHAVVHRSLGFVDDRPAGVEAPRWR